jgi:hypothetical protein
VPLSSKAREHNARAFAWEGNPMPPTREETSVDQTIRDVLAVPLWEGIGITLVRDQAGWRFGAWHRDDFGNRALPAPPSDAERLRYFESPDAAAAYFKRAYGPPRTYPA